MNSSLYHRSRFLSVYILLFLMVCPHDLSALALRSEFAVSSSTAPAASKGMTFGQVRRIVQLVEQFIDSEKQFDQPHDSEFLALLEIFIDNQKDWLGDENDLKQMYDSTSTKIQMRDIWNFFKDDPQSEVYRTLHSYFSDENLLITFEDYQDVPPTEDYQDVPPTFDPSSSSGSSENGSPSPVDSTGSSSSSFQQELRVVPVEPLGPLVEILDGIVAGLERLNLVDLLGEEELHKLEADQARTWDQRLERLEAFMQGKINDQNLDGDFDVLNQRMQPIDVYLSALLEPSVQQDQELRDLIRRFRSMLSVAQALKMGKGLDRNIKDAHTMYLVHEALLSKDVRRIWKAIYRYELPFDYPVKSMGRKPLIHLLIEQGQYPVAAELLRQPGKPLELKDLQAIDNVLKTVNSDDISSKDLFFLGVLKTLIMDIRNEIHDDWHQRLKRRVRTLESANPPQNIFQYVPKELQESFPQEELWSWKSVLFHAKQALTLLESEQRAEENFEDLDALEEYFEAIHTVLSLHVLSDLELSQTSSQNDWNGAMLTLLSQWKAFRLVFERLKRQDPLYESPVGLPFKQLDQKISPFEGRMDSYFELLNFDDFERLIELKDLVNGENNIWKNVRLTGRVDEYLKALDEMREHLDEMILFYSESSEFGNQSVLPILELIQKEVIWHQEDMRLGSIRYLLAPIVPEEDASTLQESFREILDSRALPKKHFGMDQDISIELVMNQIDDKQFVRLQSFTEPLELDMELSVLNWHFERRKILDSLWPETVNEDYLVFVHRHLQYLLDAMKPIIDELNKDPQANRSSLSFYEELRSSEENLRNDWELGAAFDLEKIKRIKETIQKTLLLWVKKEDWSLDKNSGAWVAGNIYRLTDDPTLNWWMTLVDDFQELLDQELEVLPLRTLSELTTEFQAQKDTQKTLEDWRKQLAEDLLSEEWKAFASHLEDFWSKDNVEDEDRRDMLTFVIQATSSLKTPLRVQMKQNLQEKDFLTRLNLEQSRKLVRLSPEESQRLRQATHTFKKTQEKLIRHLKLGQFISAKSVWQELTTFQELWGFSLDEGLLKTRDILAKLQRSRSPEARFLKEKLLPAKDIAQNVPKEPKTKPELRFKEPTESEFLTVIPKEEVAPYDPSFQSSMIQHIKRIRAILDAFNRTAFASEELISYQNHALGYSIAQWPSYNDVRELLNSDWDYTDEPTSEWVYLEFFERMDALVEELLRFNQDHTVEEGMAQEVEGLLKQLRTARKFFTKRTFDQELDKLAQSA